MEYDEKAPVTAPAKERQHGNRSWWTDQTMSYDWKDRVAKERFSAAWYDEIDERFLHGARLFIDRDRPFAELMQLDTLKGKRVLEIGCGMGFHAELLSRSGADLERVISRGQCRNAAAYVLSSNTVRTGKTPAKASLTLWSAAPGLPVTATTGRRRLARAPATSP